MLAPDISALLFRLAGVSHQAFLQLDRYPDGRPAQHRLAFPSCSLNPCGGCSQQVVTLHGSMEGRARLISRESLPVADDCGARPDAPRPALQLSPQHRYAVGPENSLQLDLAIAPVAVRPAAAFLRSDMTLLLLLLPRAGEPSAHV
jgi:hypothetical protein